MDKCYIYKNEFVGLLNLIIFLLKNNIKPDNIKNELYTPTLLENIIKFNIKYDETIINYFIKHFDIYILSIIYDVYLSNNDKKELIIYYFIKNTLKYKNNIIYMRNLKCVTLALKISKYVRNENHKYKGFLRFKELKNNVLYATIEPVNDVLILLSNHFKNRLKNEYWCIEDKNRNKICLYDKKSLYFFKKDEFKLYTNEMSKNEENIENLWKQFYKTIGIESRKNNKCRMNFMPKRYWNCLIEKDEL